MSDYNEPAEICYETNFVKQVIFRVDFANEIEQLNFTLPDAVRAAAAKYFPIAEPKQQIVNEVAFLFNVGAGEPNDRVAPGKQEKLRNWVFHNETKSHSIDISKSAVVLIIRKYGRYADVREELLAITEPLLEEFAPVVASRLGLRFINLISLDEPSPLDWSKYLHPRLLTRMQEPPKDGGQLIRDMHSMEVRFADCNIRFQSGIPNPDYPAAVQKKEFLLDIDAHRAGVIDGAEFAAAFDSFHNRIQDYFEMNILDGLRDKMLNKNA